MATVSLAVQLDLSGSVFGTTFAATDESSYALAGLNYSPITVTWGRQDEFSTVTPTSVSSVFKNQDGRFTPGLTTGALYPRVRRNLRRRVIATVSGTPVNLSEDYATSLNVLPDRVLTTTEISGQDILARFGGTPSSGNASPVVVGTALRSFIAEEVLLDSPSFLYMLQEAEGATTFADVTGTGTPLTIINSKYGAGAVDAGQTVPQTFVGGTFVNIDNSAYMSTGVAGSGLQATVPATSGAAFTLEMWVLMPSGPTANTQMLFQVGVNKALQIAATTGVLSFCGLSTGSSVCDGKIHHIAGTLTSTTATIYLDGVSVATTSGSFNTTTDATINLFAINSSIVANTCFTGSIAYAAMCPTALSGARIAAHYAAGANAFQGERTDARITRLLSYRPDTGSVLDTGLGTMGMQDIQGRSLADCLLEVGQVEAGAVYVDGQGRVNFRSRSRLFNPIPVLTLDCSQGAVDFGTDFTDTTQNALNDVTVTGSTGSDQRYYNAASIATDGELATSVSLPLNADSDALNLAGWMVANGVQEQIVASPLNVDLLHCPAATALGVLQLAPLDCIQVTNCPTGAPASTLTFIVQGGSLSLAVDAASASLNTTIASTATSGAVAVWDSTNWDASPVWAF